MAGGRCAVSTTCTRHPLGFGGGILRQELTGRATGRKSCSRGLGREPDERYYIHGWKTVSRSAGGRQERASMEL